MTVDEREVQRLLRHIQGRYRVRLSWMAPTENGLRTQNRYYKPTKHGLYALAKKLGSLLDTKGCVTPAVSVEVRPHYWHRITRAVCNGPAYWYAVGNRLRVIKLAQRGKPIMEV